MTIENKGREIIANAIDEEMWERKVWKPPSDCMNTDKGENKRMREKIVKPNRVTKVYSDGRGGVYQIIE